AFWEQYLSLLGAFWMTAPLAWLYAVPYERFLSPHAAVDANLYTLGVVALWRLVLMVRIVEVCSGLRWSGAIFCVLFFSGVLATVAMVAYLALEMSVIPMMGGFREMNEPKPYRGPEWVWGLVCIGAVPIALLTIGALIARLARNKDNTWPPPWGWLEQHDGTI